MEKKELLIVNNVKQINAFWIFVVNQIIIKIPVPNPTDFSIKSCIFLIIFNESLLITSIVEWGFITLDIWYVK